MTTQNSTRDFPYEIVEMNSQLDTESEQIENSWMSGGCVRVGPKGFVFPNKYREESTKIYNLKILPGDIFVSGYPRSGTTFTQMAVWLITNELDYEECRKIRIDEKFFFLERHVSFINVQKYRDFLDTNSPDENLRKYASQKLLNLESLPESGPRYFKTHSPLPLLPPALLDTGKMVFVARDPRDTIVSYYHLMKSTGYRGDFKTIWSYFVNDMMFWCPYFELVKEAWDKRDNDNLLFIFYENLLNDRIATLRVLANFFGKQYTDEQLSRLAHYLEFDNLKNDGNYNHENLSKIGILKPEEAAFIRKGKCGGWREYFDEEMSQRTQLWISENLRGTDLRFPSLDANNT